LSWLTIYDNARKGTLKGLLASGMSGVDIGPDSKRMPASLGELEWLVTMDPLQTATATFWQARGIDPTGVDTEVLSLDDPLDREGWLVRELGPVDAVKVQGVGRARRGQGRQLDYRSAPPPVAETVEQG